MSTNCIRCGEAERTGTDLYCDKCRSDDASARGVVAIRQKEKRDMEAQRAAAGLDVHFEFCMGERITHKRLGVTGYVTGLAVHSGGTHWALMEWKNDVGTVQSEHFVSTDLEVAPE